MKKSTLFALWGGMFIVCGALGFIPQPQGGLKTVLLLAALVFFVPPALLVQSAGKSRDIALLKLIRNLSLLSLGLSTALILLNILCAAGSETLGSILNSVLILVSSPMICSGSWALSLFLWACLLMVSLSQLKKLRS